MTLKYTRDELIALRGIFQFMADDWDDPLMDAYDELYGVEIIDPPAPFDAHYTDVAQLIATWKDRQERNE